MSAHTLASVTQAAGLGIEQRGASSKARTLRSADNGAPVWGVYADRSSPTSCSPAWAWRRSSWLARRPIWLRLQSWFMATVLGALALRLATQRGRS
jgi:hypothetical protein